MENNKLNEALFNAIYEIEAVKKNMKGYNYKYADLSSVLEAVKEPCRKNGLYFVQPHRVDNFQPIEITDKQGHTIKKMSGVVSVITEIYHKEDTEKREYITSCMVEDATDPQKVGSIITYLRRYALVSIFAMEQDDDGLGAKKREDLKKENDSVYNEKKDLYENPIDYSIAPIGTIKGKKWEQGDLETLCQAKEYFRNRKDKDSLEYYKVISEVIEKKKTELFKDYTVDVQGNACQGDEIIFEYKGGIKEAIILNDEYVKIKDNVVHYFELRYKDNNVEKINGGEVYKSYTFAKPRDKKERQMFLNIKQTKRKEAEGILDKMDNTQRIEVPEVHVTEDDDPFSDDNRSLQELIEEQEQREKTPPTSDATIDEEDSFVFGNKGGKNV